MRNLQIGVKRHSKINGLEKRTPKLGSVEKVSSLRAASPTTRKVPVIKNIVQGSEFGAKALRKSWEGNMEVKTGEKSKLRAAKHDPKTEARSTSVSLIINLKTKWHRFLFLFLIVINKGYQSFTL